MCQSNELEPESKQKTGGGTMRVSGKNLGGSLAHPPTL